VSCHLPDLEGQQQMPRLAKQRIDYLLPTLKSYRDAPRPGADTAMSAAIAGASDDDIAALANFAADGTAKSGRPGTNGGRAIICSRRHGA
jgi:cytochrome c553